MSLGWNSESALMPKKAKKIDAPAGSMEALKAETFAASMSAARGGKYARGTAKPRRKDADDLDSAGRKRPRHRDKRKGGPRDDDDGGERAAASRRCLAAKAQLYDDLKRGEVEAPAEVLVDFGDAAPPAPAAPRRRNPRAPRPAPPLPLV
mmetsp:Transcript_634/g.1890  ORF Transcript_634/g.1890 Transcript_634/m.1890 type:complete len:150 (+) Transcript_634:292-741(+)